MAREWLKGVAFSTEEEAEEAARGSRERGYTAIVIPASEETKKHYREFGETPTYEVKYSEKQPKLKLTYEGSEEILSPFVTHAKGTYVHAAQVIHSRRSKRARIADENQNAPLTTDIKIWRKHKNRLDFPTVDTISLEVQAKRAKRKQEELIQKGAFHSVIRKGRSQRYRGQFYLSGVPTVTMKPAFPTATSERLRKKKVQVKSYPGVPQILIPLSTSDFYVPRVLGHEMGHAVDWALMKKRSKKQQLYEKESAKYRAWNQDLDIVPSSVMKKDEYRDQAEKIAKRMFGGWEKTSNYKYKLYRQSSKELFADVYSSYVVEPRAFKREAPLLAKLFKNL